MNARLDTTLLALLLAACCAATGDGASRRDVAPLRIKLYRETLTMGQQGALEGCTRALKPLPLNRTLYLLEEGGRDLSTTTTTREKEQRRECQVALSVAPFVPFKGVIQIGEPAQQFRALFDTASHVLWVAHSRCHQAGLPWDSRQLAKFASDKSSTYRRIGRERVSLRQANEMELKGWWVSDLVRLADAQSKGAQAILEVPEQPIAMICNINGPENPFRPLFEARVGLSFSFARAEAGRAERASLLDNMLARGLLREPVFSFHTQPMLNRQEAQVGELVLGQIDPALYTGAITWTPVTRLPLWEIRVHSIRLMGRDEPRETPVAPSTGACAHGCQAVLDSGADAIFGPEGEIELLNKKLGLARNHYDRNLFFKRGSCLQTVPHTMTLVFQIGTTYLELKPEAYLLEWTDRMGAKFCFSALRGREPKDTKGEDSPHTWTLGSSFIAGFYTIFDLGQRRVGFAQPV